MGKCRCRSSTQIGVVRPQPSCRINFLEGVGVDVDPNMIVHPRESSYVRMDGWDEEAARWFQRKAESQAAA